MEQLILTRRGIVGISEIIIGDEVYTHKKRWRRVEGIRKGKATEAFKHKYSFFTPLSPELEVVTVPKGLPYFAPRQSNHDKNKLDYWYDVGRSINATAVGHFVSVKGVGNVYDPSFKIPFTVMTLPPEKTDAFLTGLFNGANKIDVSKINKRARLALSLMRIKLSDDYDYRASYTVTEFSSVEITPREILILDVAEDKSYNCNGVYIKLTER